MVYSLDDSLRLVLPHIHSCLISQEVVFQIRNLAGMLPNLHWAGFECRLGENPSLAGFHQGITSNKEPSVFLKNHISASKQLSNDPVWGRVRDFCDEWEDPTSPLYGHVTKMGLEFDLPDSPLSRIYAPSVFMALKQEEDQDASTKQVLEVVNAAVKILKGKDLTSRVKDNLVQCLDVCPNGVRILHIGIMLSRDLQAIRLNMAGIRPEFIKTFLDSIKWEGASNDFEILFYHVYDLVEDILLSLDIGERVYSKIGMECFPGNWASRKSSWIPFFDYLIGNSLCTAAKRDALLAWPGYSTPYSSSRPWPGDLIIESLLHAPNKLGLIYRSLNHVKIDFQLGKSLQAKGYLEFIHRWIELHRDE